MSEIVITGGGSVGGVGSLILSDGDRQQEFVGGADGLGVWLAPELNLPLVAKENTYAESSDSEGRRRIRSRPLNGEGTFNLWIAGEDEADFWYQVDDLQELCESAHRNKGTLHYEPPRGAPAVTFDLEACRVSGLPQRGVLLRQLLCQPEVEFEWLPYGRLDPVALVTAETLTGPVDSFEVAAVGGHSDAFGDLTLVNTETAPISWVEIGQENGSYDPSNPAPLFIGPDDLTPVAGVLDPGNAINTALTTSPVVTLSTGAQPHIGRWRIKILTLTNAESIYVRLVWRRGDGPWTQEAWKVVPIVGSLYELDLGLVDIAEVSGTHSWEGRIEAYAQANGDDIGIAHVICFPATSYYKGRAPVLSQTSTSVEAADSFGGSSTLHGAAADIGGNWDSDDAGWDAVDFTKSGGVAARTENSDASVTAGRGAVLGAGTETTQTVQADIKATYGAVTGEKRLGVLARYVDTSNWLMAVMRGFTLNQPLRQVALYKRVAGTTTLLGATPYLAGDDFDWRTIKLSVDEDGNATVFEGPRSGTLTERLSVAGDADLAPSGDLEAGKFGIYDVCTSTSGTNTRVVDNFLVSTEDTSISSDAVIFPSQSARFLHNKAERESSDGTAWGDVLSEGNHLRLPPATRANRVSRIAVLTRRADLDGNNPADGLADEVTADLSIVPRVVLTSRT